MEDWNNPHSSGAGGKILATLDGVTLKLSNVRSAKNGKWKLTGYVGKSDGQVRVFDKIHEIPSDLWMHAAIVYAPSISKVQLYLDGTLVDEQGDVHPKFYDKFVNPFKVGTWFKKNEAYRGYIDEVKLYNYAKTSKEISDEFKSLMAN